jgi:hypothetical protein
MIYGEISSWILEMAWRYGIARKIDSFKARSNETNIRAGWNVCFTAVGIEPPNATSELHKYLEREFESKKWSQFRVNRADKNNRKGLELTSNSSFNFRYLGKECAEISYFDIDLKNNTMVLWTNNLASWN